MQGAPINPSQPGSSFGSGTSLLGAPASQVLAQPGGIQQQTPASASFQPGMLPPQMSPMPGAQPVPTQPQGAPQAPQSPSSPTVGMPPNEAAQNMITKALISQLTRLGKADDHAKGIV